MSNKIAFANPNAPVYPRLALGKSWNEVSSTSSVVDCITEKMVVLLFFKIKMLTFIT